MLALPGWSTPCLDCGRLTCMPPGSSPRLSHWAAPIRAQSPDAQATNLATCPAAGVLVHPITLHISLCPLLTLAGLLNDSGHERPSFNSPPTWLFGMSPTSDALSYLSRAYYTSLLQSSLVHRDVIHQLKNPCITHPGASAGRREALEPCLSFISSRAAAFSPPTAHQLLIIFAIPLPGSFVYHWALLFVSRSLVLLVMTLERAAVSSPLIHGSKS
ncbi:hypothetical protein V8C42DRAFT_248504 [Trichoderma barbatum]